MVVTGLLDFGFDGGDHLECSSFVLELSFFVGVFSNHIDNSSIVRCDVGGLCY